MRFFLAGIMQGSHLESRVHGQEYRSEIARLLHEHFPEAEIYDPRAEHSESLSYEEAEGRRVFFGHNRMCRDIDVLVAYVPQASMGTAIEMWEAHQHGAAVLTISPLRLNWTVQFLSHAVYADLNAFDAAIRNGDAARVIARVRELGPGSPRRS
ncbi:MAG: hypothetical protein ABFC96_01000 [Thermoguttaceae bacterium]